MPRAWKIWILQDQDYFFREVTPRDLVPTKWNTLPSFPTKQAIPSQHDNLAGHGICHASELIRVTCEGSIWFRRLQAYQLYQACYMVHKEWLYHQACQLR